MLPEHLRKPVRDSREHNAKTRIFSGCVLLLDAFMVVLASALAYALTLNDVPLGYHLAPGLAGALLLINFLQLSHAHHFLGLTSLLPQIWRITSAWTGTILLLLLAGFVTGIATEYTLHWFIGWYVLGWSLLTIGRCFSATLLKYLQKSGHLATRIVVVGTDIQAERFIREIEERKQAACRILGVFDDRGEERAPVSVCGALRLGTTDDLLLYARHTKIDQIVIALPWDAEERIMGIMQKLRALPVDVQLCPDTENMLLSHREVSHLGGVTLLNLSEQPISGWNLFLKELEDRLLAALILIPAAPVMLIIALLIKLDSPGPVFFRQKRHGFNHEIFYAWKFRTMKHRPPEENSFQQATKNDNRITRLGKFLRKSSLDELPQLLNVLSGEMSLVGPRPHPVELNEQFSSLINDYMARHSVKPGITGLAQVNGCRGETDTVEKMAERIRYDLTYIENWSLLLDIVILCKTALVGFVHKNAY